MGLRGSSQGLKGQGWGKKFSPSCGAGRGWGKKNPYGTGTKIPSFGPTPPHCHPYTLAYSQSNGQAEAVNKTILSGLKKRLDGAKGNWAEELPNVLWAYRTTPYRSTGETLFSLTYGAEAVIPAEVNLCSAQVDGFNPAHNEQMMLKQLDSLEEYQEAATIRLAEYQQKLARSYN